MDTEIDGEAFLNQSGDDGDAYLAQDGSEDMVCTGYTPAPFVTSDFESGFDDPVEPNPVTLARQNSKNSRKLKKTNMQKDLKVYKNNEKDAMRLNNKKQKEKEKDDKKAKALLKKGSTKPKAPNIKKAKSRSTPVTPNPEEHDADAEDGVQSQQQAAKIKKAKSRSTPVTPNPEEHDADAEDGVQLQQEQQHQDQMIKRQKLDEHQAQKRKPKAIRKQTKELQLFESMTEQMCKWNIDVHRKNSGEERGLGIFALR